MSLTARTAASLVCALQLGGALAQQPPVDGGDRKVARIARADQAAPVIDGRLDDAVWQRATMIEDLHQVTPVEYATPTEPTTIYLLYDSEMLYVGARMFDREPELINARILRQNQPIGSDDRLFVQIDPFGNRRSGYLFGVNPNGVRFDGVFQNITDRQFDWDGIYEAEAVIDEQGWTAELAIPFKTLSFDPSSDTWRLNFVRNLIRRNEQMAWASRNRSTDPTTMGSVTGFDGIEQGVGLDVVASTSVRERKLHVEGRNDSNAEPSLDIFYKVTPALNAALTLNTDFSATEVDNRQVNLTRFNLFFPERRDFFLQDLDIFQFASIGRLNTGNDGLENSATTRPARENGRPFFSRRLGIGPLGDEVALDYGGKLSGRVGRWDVGALTVKQDEYSFLQLDPFDPTAPPVSVLVEPATAVVGRVVRNILGESSIGLITTSGDPTSNRDNTLVGTDFRYVNSRLPGGRRLEAEAWYQESDTEGLSADQAAAGAGFRIPNNTGLRGGLAVKRIEANFNPALGFISRAGIDETTFELGHTWRPAARSMQTLFAGLDAQRIEFLDDGAVQSEVLSLRALEIETRARDRLNVRLMANKEGLRLPFEISPGVVIPAGVYRFDEHEAEISTGNQRVWSGNFTYRSGDFFGGERLRLNSSVAWRPNRHFRASIESEYNDIALPQGDFIVRLVRLQLETAFSSTLSWVNLIQYDNVSELVGLNSRVHWIPRAGREGFIVINHNLEDFDRDNSFHSAFAELTLKFGYTFRF